MIDPKLKIMREQQRERRRILAKMNEVLAAQLDRIQDSLNASTQRIHTEYRRCTLDEMEAQLELKKHVGSGGYTGPKRASLARLEGEIEG